MYTDVEQNVAKNLAELRKAKNLKQSELGASVGYSDKTISKWENGASVPDIAALASLADFFGVSVDDILRENATDKIADNKEKATKEDKINAYATLCLSIVTVILIAVMVYVGLEITRGYRLWQAFVWAVPPSMAATMSSLSMVPPSAYRSRYSCMAALNSGVSTVG